jgi:hypothetical protein
LGCGPSAGHFAAFKAPSARSRFKVQKSLNLEDRQGREEKQVFVGPEGQKEMAL